MIKNKKLRCDDCGKFISYAEILKKNIFIEFTPDTEVTIEEIKFIHKKHK